MNTNDSPAQGLDEKSLAVAKLQREVQFLTSQNEKLSFEMKELMSEGAWVRKVNRLLPVITGLLAVAGFWFGIIQYLGAEKKAYDQRQAAEDSRIEQEKTAAATPLWDKQLKLYIEATEVAAIIATTKDPEQRKLAEQRFWVLYWGPLAAVEDVGLMKQDSADIEAAMVRFGEALRKKSGDGNANDLEQLSLNLAHSVRKSIAPTFDVKSAVPVKGAQKASQ